MGSSQASQGPATLHQAPSLKSHLRIWGAAPSDPAAALSAQCFLRRKREPVAHPQANALLCISCQGRALPLAPCSLFFASRTPSCVSERESKVLVYAHARCWLGGGGTGSLEQGGGDPGLFRSQAPRFPLIQEGASSLPPQPPFPRRRAESGEQITLQEAGPGCAHPL